MSCWASGSKATATRVKMAPNCTAMLWGVSFGIVPNEENSNIARWKFATKEHKKNKTHAPLVLSNTRKLPNGPLVAPSIRSKSISGLSSLHNNIHFHCAKHSDTTYARAALIVTDRIEMMVFRVTPRHVKTGFSWKCTRRTTSAAKHASERRMVRYW